MSGVPEATGVQEGDVTKRSLHWTYMKFYIGARVEVTDGARCFHLHAAVESESVPDMGLVRLI